MRYIAQTLLGLLQCTVMGERLTSGLWQVNVVVVVDKFLRVESLPDARNWHVIIISYIMLHDARALSLPMHH